MGGIALIDYGAGNLHSVHNALKAAGAGNLAITSDPDIVRNAERIVLPGVGAFGASMAGLRAMPGLIDAMEERVLGDGAPFLGVCVGMQLMAEYGEEHGLHKGLGWVAGTIKPIQPSADFRVPHMGWNDVFPVRDDVALIEPGEAYFLHGYSYIDGQSPSAVTAITEYGRDIVAAIQVGTAVGVQFHPEKSQRYGIALLERFLAWRP